MAYTTFYTGGFLNDAAGNTPIDEDALNHIESGITDAASDADAAGTAAASATTTANSAASSAATALAAAGTALQATVANAKGDILVATADNTVSVLTVGAAGKILIPNSAATEGLKWTGGFATSLPSSPVDGEEVILVDSLSAPTYQWHLKYISAATTYKWYCIGGTAAHAVVDTSQSTASTSYTALGTAGPSFTVPVAGDYFIQIGCGATVSAAGIALMSYDVGGTAALDTDAAYAATVVNSSNASSLRKKTSVAASTAIVAKYKVTANTGTWVARYMTVTPIRVN